MALRPQDTHKADYHASGVILHPYLSYLFSNLQDMGISDKIVKIDKNDKIITCMARKATLTRRDRLTRMTRLPILTIRTRLTTIN